MRIRNAIEMNDIELHPITCYVQFLYVLEAKSILQAKAIFRN